MSQMISSDILVVGGGPAGMIVATTAKSYYPDKKIVIVRRNKEALVPCAIPYIFGNTLGSSSKNIVPAGKITESGVELFFDDIVDVDIDKKIATGKSGDTYKYEKLVFATGSSPNAPKSLGGVDSCGVFTVPKDRSGIDTLKEKIEEKKRVVVVGTGFIGIEVAVELAEHGKEVVIICEVDRVLNNALDIEFTKDAEEIIQNKGIRLIKNARVEQILCDMDKTTGVKLATGEIIETDFVILGIGYHPDNFLAQKIGLRIGKKGGIWVDEYMRTEIPDVFAVGDCASKQHFITRKTVGIMLASTSTAEARVCATSMYKIEYIKGFSGTIAIFSTVIGGKTFASAGITEEEANTENIDIVTGIFEGIDKHPASIPGCQKQTVKLIATRRSGTIIGGQVSGGVSAGEMINVIGLIIENKMNIYALLDLQVATHPLLTAPPTAYPIVKAAEIIDKKIYSCQI
jgi:NADPH-dependent 2,4-dienoyl-CoA reductase/sulfur reductase-like enzyme